jgi:hypothetical protein
MVMARTAKYNRNEVIADWEIGKYTVRDLAHKHKISIGTVHNIVSGIDKKIEPLVNKQVSINQELANLNEHELNNFKQEVDERSRYIIRKNTCADLAFNKIEKELPQCETRDVKGLVEALDKVCVIAEIAPRFNPNAGTNIQNNVNTTNVTLVDALERAKQRIIDGTRVN